MRIVWAQVPHKLLAELSHLAPMAGCAVAAKARLAHAGELTFQAAGHFRAVGKGELVAPATTTNSTNRR